MWKINKSEWDADVPSDKFKYKKKSAPKKPKKSKKKLPEEQSEGGLFVRVRRPVEVDITKLSNSANVALKRPEANSTADTQKKNKKRKHVQSESTENDTFKKKKHKVDIDSEEAFNPPKDKKQKDKAAIPSVTTSFEERLRNNLKGSRFRFINQQLYQTSGEDAFKLFKNDPGAFHAYHEGYSTQVEQWPLNPLKRIINSIRKIPKSEIVADFGCGEGQLAKSVSHKVYSLDLVAANDNVIACDMANTPLKSDSINIVVFCLSLMGTNLKDFILEANRVLKIGGKLKIAEVQSRFANVYDFIKIIEKCGFILLNKDLSHELFAFMDFKKTKLIDSKASKVINNFSLKPCMYKKR